MGYMSDWKKAEARKKLEAEIVQTENEVPVYERRIKAVSDNLGKNNTKANRRAKRLMMAEVKGLKGKIVKLKAKANETE